MHLLVKRILYILWHLREVINRKYVASKIEQIKVETTDIHSKKYSISKMDFLIISQLHARTPLKNPTAAGVDMNFPFSQRPTNDPYTETEDFCSPISILFI